MSTITPDEVEYDAPDLTPLKVHGAARELLRQLGVDGNDPNFVGTPSRFTDYLMEHFINQEDVDTALSDISAAVFPSKYRGMVIERGITANGICPHHLLPVQYRVAVGYLVGSDKGALGLSKLTRLVRVFARQPILQEDVTEKVVDALEAMLKTSGCGVVIEGQHACMSLRGVRNQAEVITSAVRGAFREDGTVKQEFMTLLRTEL